MTEYNFTFIVSDVDIQDDGVIGKLLDAGCDDATFSLLKGQFGATFDRESDTYRDAVLSAYDNLVSTGVDISHFEPDYLVSQVEIGLRANVTRQAVSAWVAGARGIDFPAPKHRLETKSPLWDWVDVSIWLHSHNGLPEEIVREAQISRAVNAFVQLGENAFGGCAMFTVVDSFLERPIAA